MNAIAALDNALSTLPIRTGISLCASVPQTLHVTDNSLHQPILKGNCDETLEHSKNIVSNQRANLTSGEKTETFSTEEEPIVESGSYVARLLKHGPEAEVSKQFYKHCVVALHAPNKAAMVLDDCGKVLYCNDEASDLLNHQANDLIGLRMRDLVPELPLDAEAPESNVARVTNAGGKNRWLKYCILDATGASSSVEFMLDVLVVNLRHLILLGIRAPERHSDWTEYAAESGSDRSGEARFHTGRSIAKSRIVSRGELAPQPINSAVVLSSLTSRKGQPQIVAEC